MSRLRSQLVASFLCVLPLTPCALHAAPLSAFLMHSGTTKHHGKKDTREQIADLEQQWRAATLAADVPALDKLLADDYVGISWSGQVNTKASQLDRLRNKTLVLSRLEVTEVKIKVVGPVAIVTSHSNLLGMNDGVEIKGAFVYTRIYQRGPSGVWKITNFEATRIPAEGHGVRRSSTEAPPS